LQLPAQPCSLLPSLITDRGGDCQSIVSTLRLNLDPGGFLLPLL
jgi:hypothetical protein